MPAAALPAHPLAHERRDFETLQGSAGPSGAHNTARRRRPLALRQRMKKASSNLVRARSHLAFVSHCTRQDQIPKGLRIKTICQALLKEQTSVEDRFTKTTRDAERQYLAHLQSHYRHLEGTLAEEQASRCCPEVSSSYPVITQLL